MAKKIIWVNGCFDLLHEGHIDMLRQAKEQGDYLIIGLNSDASVRANKGPGRPVDNEETRKRKLLATGFVDEVMIFSDKTPIEIIRKVKPDIIVRGHDQTIEPEISEFKFYRAKKFRDISTTKLLKKPQ